ncbi:regulatory protein RecX [Sphingobacterium griseoflavum]|uniref:Regulatory protein RecX n=1 Tax=Sphingobacterium griseoflavum TaxID=1474952 RepID=A0ABQ3HY02_9SPHI|nr:RecX family transcriptional regulator [Sphingobacterium griseoflavum]GHE44899.1 recombinase RecX [Sphingobacterium griseoflavum]
MDDRNKDKKIYTPLQAKQKAESYCAYQERAQQEVRDKLYSWGMNEENVENIIALLIEENFLNEERFAKAYALGKFRMLGWGKIKIRQHLKAKRVSEPLIRMALREISDEEYGIKVRNLVNKRTKTPLNKISSIEKSKMFKYLLSKGFESDIIQDIIKINI